MIEVAAPYSAHSRAGGRSYPSPERGGSGAQRRGWGMDEMDNSPHPAHALQALTTLPRKRGRDKKGAFAETSGKLAVPDE
jgi:hypothetical protein